MIKNEWQVLAEKLLFDFGKSVLGKNAGGQIVKLLKAKGIDGARNIIMAASAKQDPSEFVGAALREANGTKPVVDYDAVAARHGYHWNGDKYIKQEAAQ
jgi:hypothetical protein